MLQPRIDPAPTSQGQAMTADVRATLGQILAGLDGRFMGAGQALAQTLETIDRMVQGLCEIGDSFARGDAGTAIDDLTAVAQRLNGVPEQQRRRSTEIAGIRSIATRLGERASEMEQVLDVLRIHGVNVKIAASGSPEFVDFADRMHGQIRQGEAEIKRFSAKLTELKDALGGVENADRLLHRECANILPDIPNRLVSDAAALRDRQAQLARQAQEAQEIARAVQGHVATILGAVQIGDITRQRLEHVVQGCEMLEAWLAEAQDDARGAGGALVLRMLAAQLADIGGTFSRETALLVQSLAQIVPEASRLLASGQARDSIADSQHFLRRVEAGMSEAQAMTARLRDADRQAESITSLILATVDDLNGRTRAVRNLRLDVQLMAINIGLRCRRVGDIGRPTAVIANEIRTYSDILGQIATSIDEAGPALGDISLTMRTRDGVEGQNQDYSLEHALKEIGRGAQLTEQAMANVGDEAGEIVGLLRDTGARLDASLAIEETVGRLAAQLEALAGNGPAIDAEGDAELQALFAQIARIYTMASERSVHGRFATPSAVIATETAVPTEDDDDDALF